MTRWTFGLILCGMWALGTGVASRGYGACDGLPACDDQAVVEPEGYRSEDYRAPTPKSLRGARVISTAEAQAIWKAGTAAFVDVMPHIPRPANLPAGTLWREKARLNIPGSVWLADTGYGELSAATEDYLRAGLEQIAGGDRARPLAFYCLRACWMSWNAAKRAVSWGYTDVMWYPDGTDGWQEAGLPLEEGRPATRAGQ
jgi:PQQ-dependent catabolism-associated CXXCW motif protein